MIFKKQSLVESFPAYDVFEREADRSGFVNITVDDILAVNSGKGFYRTYSPGSVVSYALEYNECPIQAVADCLAKMKSDPYGGHKLYWINGRGSVLTAHKRAAEQVVKVKIGMKVRFEGKLFTIESAWNQNLAFKEYVEEAVAA